MRQSGTGWSMDTSSTLARGDRFSVSPPMTMMKNPGSDFVHIQTLFDQSPCNYDYHRPGSRTQGCHWRSLGRRCRLARDRCQTWSTPRSRDRKSRSCNRRSWCRHPDRLLGCLHPRCGLPPPGTDLGPRTARDKPLPLEYIVFGREYFSMQPSDLIITVWPISLLFAIEMLSSIVSHSNMSNARHQNGWWVRLY